MNEFAFAFIAGMTALIGLIFLIDLSRQRRMKQSGRKSTIKP